MTGTATSVEAAMTWPQSVARVALGWTKPRSHSGSVSLLGAHDDERNGELVPRLQEREDAGGHEPGREQRERDPQEGLGAAETVDHRGLFELGGHAGDEAAQHPDRERHDGRDVEQARAPMMLLSRPERAHHLVLGDEEALGGEHLDSRIAMMNDSRPRNLNRLIATAARNAKSRQQNTAIRVTRG